MTTWKKIWLTSPSFVSEHQELVVKSQIILVATQNITVYILRNLFPWKLTVRTLHLCIKMESKNAFDIMHL